LGARPTKRVVFDHSEYEDVLGNLKIQIKEKKDRKELDQMKKAVMD